MSMKLHLASGNAHKVAEFQALVAASGLAIDVISAKWVGGMPAVIEDTGTFIGNARKKARALLQRLPAPAWVLSDDSGLCVDALGGAPGVDSAYYAGASGDPAANLRKLVEVLRHTPPPQRTAHFACVLVLVGSDGSEAVFEGRCEGTLRTVPAGCAGFGYDPLFVPTGHLLTFAEMAEMEKNRISHRALAWSALADHLRARLAAEPRI